MDKLKAVIQTYLAHINSIVEIYNNAVDAYGQMPDQDAIRIITRSRNLVQKIVGKDSPYTQEVEFISSQESASSYKAEIIIGVLSGLKDELTIGGLDSVPELVRGELFENFLQMAEYLANEGYKDAAAVITGSSLEAHLKHLAQKHQIEIQIPESGTKPKHKKAEMINQDLYKAKIYSPLDQKQITAWLDLRNNAAHGNYAVYSSEQVMQFIEWTKDFISKNGA